MRPNEPETGLGDGTGGRRPQSGSFLGSFSLVQYLSGLESHFQCSRRANKWETSCRHDLAKVRSAVWLDPVRLIVAFRVDSSAYAACILPRCDREQRGPTARLER